MFCWCVTVFFPWSCILSCSHGMQLGTISGNLEFWGLDADGALCMFGECARHSKVVQCAVLPIENNGLARMHEEAEARARGASWHMGRDVYVLSQRDHFIL